MRTSILRIVKRVAVTYHLGYDVEPYAEAIRAAAMEPVLVTPARPLASLDEVAGLVLCGGTDLDPALYGQQPHPEAQAPVRDRDELEQRLLREALDRDVPLLAICRGMQLLNVTHPAGSLVQHIAGHRQIAEDRSEPAHEVVVVPNTRLAAIMGAGEHPVNSRHHQAVAKVGKGLVVSARSRADNIVEGLERPDLRFAVGVQWHPENQVRRFEAQRKLFVALAGAL
jgi:putative glutamine amidotransferase